MVVATGLGGAGMIGNVQAPAPVAAADDQVAAISVAAVDLEKRALRARAASRSAQRVTLRPKPVVKKAPKPEPPAPPPPEPVAVGHQYLTTALNVWTGPGENYTFITVLATGTKVPVTGRVEGDWAEIVYDGQSRWVRAAYLVDEMPKPPEPAPEPASEPASEPSGGGGGGVSYAPCADGSSTEAGLTENAVRVYRAVCAQFPDVSSWGGLRSDGEHGEGRALDIMVSSSSLGDGIADWVRANSQALGVSEVIWSQRIWTVQRGSEGWRPMEDRGSATANHYDHVHVTVY
jgi:hypothetical protein